CSLAILALVALAAPPAIEPALAQSGENPIADFFGSIFGNPPQRPPADVRGPPPSRQQPPPYYPSGRSDAPPSQPLPSPMNLPPSNPPGGGGRPAPRPPPAAGGKGAPPPPPGRGAARPRRCAGSDAIRVAARSRFAAQCPAAGEYGTAAKRCGGR